MYHHLCSAAAIAAMVVVAVSDVRSQPLNSSAPFWSEAQAGHTTSARFDTYGGPTARKASGQIAHSTDGIWLLSETQIDTWDDAAATWAWMLKIVEQYDLVGRLTQQTIVYWLSGSWQNDHRWLTDYDEAGKLSRQTYQEWSDSNWLNVRHVIPTYDDTGNVTEFLVRSWSGDSWVNDWWMVKSYDDHGRLGEESSYEWQEQEWVQYPSLVQYTYDSLGRLGTRTVLHIEGENLTPSSREVLIYDDIGNQTNRLIDFWSDEAWRPGHRFSYTYYGGTSPEGARNGDHPDEATLTELLQENWIWHEDRWTNTTRRTGEFDGMGRQTAFTYELWEETEWVGTHRNLMEYDEAGRLATRYREAWNASAWVPVDRLTYIWQRLAGGVALEPKPDLPRSISLSQNYPNPFNPVTTIGYSLSSAGPVRLVVFDLVGRIVSDVNLGHHSAGTFQVEFDGSALPSGSYIYRIESAGTGAQRTMTVLK